jgi:serine/threonine protein kinase
MTHPIENPLLIVAAMAAAAACLALWASFDNRGVWAWLQSSPVRTATRLGPYRLEEKIGQGAMGQVYRALHVASGERRAIKLLPPDASTRDRERFEDEAKLGARIHHPNAVSIFDRGQAQDGTPYYAMELLEGTSLQALVEREGPLSATRVIPILRQLCAALEQAHGQGLVHRDIKPDNVLICRRADGSEQVKLIDFGLVRRVSGGSSSAGANEVVGTPLYLAPEALTAPASVNAKSDLYALGALAYFLLRGQPVFGGRSVVEVCCQHLHATPAPLALPGSGIPERLERIVLDCLAKNPSERPASAAELERRLAACGDVVPAEKRPGARITRLERRCEAQDRCCAIAA